MIYILSFEHGAFWFQNSDLFRDPIFHTKTLSKIGDEYKRSDKELIVAFKDKYSNPLPPSWMILEITSFGTLSMLYKYLKPGRSKRDIAHHFGLSDKVFETWLHSIVYMRNVCAHHTRLWNSAMSIRSQFPISPRKTWIADDSIPNNKAYFMLCMIKFLLQTVNPDNSFTIKIIELLTKYPNIDILAMGFPAEWQKEELWNY